jgi:hypothetical protein
MLRGAKSARETILFGFGALNDLPLGNSLQLHHAWAILQIAPTR